MAPVTVTGSQSFKPIVVFTVTGRDGTDVDRDGRNDTEVSVNGRISAFTVNGRA